MASDRTSIGPYVVGEIPSPLEYTFLEADGSPMDLTGYTAKYVVRPVDSDISVSYTASVTNPANGEVTYTWDGTELSEPGLHWSEFWVGNSVNRYASLRLEYSVRASVGAVPLI